MNLCQHVGVAGLDDIDNMSLFLIYMIQAYHCTIFDNNNIMFIRCDQMVVSVVFSVVAVDNHPYMVQKVQYCESKLDWVYFL